MEKIFYRIANNETGQGLWYDTKGRFTGLIHDKFSFCKNTALPMPFDPSITGYLSATQTLEELYQWFSLEDITRLEEYGYFITVYRATDYRYYQNHWLINQESSFVVAKMPVTLNQVA